MSAPLATLNGFLKQVSRESLDPIAECVLNKAFPRFWPADPGSAEWRKRTEALRASRVDYIFHDVYPPRRFAGCWSLPRSRYFSLCTNEMGDDQNTLVKELNSHLDPLRAGLLLFADMAVPEGLEAFRKQVDASAEQGSYIVVVVLGRPGAISPVIDLLDQQGLIPHESNTQRTEYCLIGARIPYSVRSREIANTLDLRLPKCQEYIVEEFFKKDSEQLSKSERSGISRFVESLPILMHPALGGGPMAEDNGAILQALASFVRSQGANALVYPSARSDVLTEVKFGTLVRWRGWCLLDYTGADDPLMSEVIDVSPGWPTTFPKGTQVRVATNDEFSGSFEVKGIAKWSRDRVGEEETEFLRAQRSPSE
jgi:hypothetical protein